MSAIANTSAPSRMTAAEFPRSADSGRWPEQCRKLIVRLIFIVYFLLILEGALRKWVFPAFGKEIFFIRDPFVLAIYALAIAGKLWTRPSPIILFGALLSILVIPLALIQVAGGLIPLYIAIYGWRCYFLYIPLAVVIGNAFRRADLDRLIKYTLLLSVPMAALAAAQRKAPSGAPINAGIFEEGGTQYNKGFIVANGIVRTTGTFTTSLGLECFSSSAVAMMLATWLMQRKKRAVQGFPLIVATTTTLTCVVLDGNRGALLSAGIILIGAFAATAIIGRTRVLLRLVIATVMLAAGLVVVIPTMFPDQYDAIASRWIGASRSEGGDTDVGIPFQRIWSMLFGFTVLIPITPIGGLGFGNAGNGAQLTDGTVLTMSSGEIETGWGRHIADLGPFLGVAYIIFRCGLTFWLFKRGFKATRRAGDPLPFLLFAYIAAPLLFGLLSAQGTVNGYGWMFAGFTLAAVESSGAFRARQKLANRTSLL